ncbi:MAG: M23 family metallopeptidase [Erysipelotrichaceae bacterium]
MNDMNHIRKRIHNRNYQKETKHKKHYFFKFLYRSTILIMIMAILALGYGINERAGFINLAKAGINININKISSWLPFEDWFSLKDESVSSKPSYTLLKDRSYTNGTNSVYALLNGVIIHIQKDKENHYLVSVAHDNGVVATYGNLLSCDSKVNERIIKDDIIGSFHEHITLDLIKDKKEITLEHALST